MEPEAAVALVIACVVSMSAGYHLDTITTWINDTADRIAQRIVR